MNPDCRMSPAFPFASIAAEVPAGDPSRFIVGQDPAGLWVAVEVHGRAGGLFRSCKAAVHYAEGETDHRADAVVLSAEQITLRL